MRYQVINPDNRIVNSTPFGRRLRRFLRKPEQKALLPKGGSWRSDGCWILADALVHWSGHRLDLACLRDLDGRIGHVVATDPRVRAFIDADGVAGQVELMTKMAVVMRAPNVALSDFTTDDARQSGLHYHEDIAFELAMRLLHRFGRYRPELLDPREAAAPDHSTVPGFFQMSFA